MPGWRQSPEQQRRRISTTRRSRASPANCPDEPAGVRTCGTERPTSRTTSSASASASAPTLTRNTGSTFRQGRHRVRRRRCPDLRHDTYVLAGNGAASGSGAAVLRAASRSAKLSPVSTSTASSCAPVGNRRIVMSTWSGSISTSRALFARVWRYRPGRPPEGGAAVRSSGIRRSTTGETLLRARMSGTAGAASGARSVASVHLLVVIARGVMCRRHRRSSSFGRHRLCRTAWLGTTLGACGFLTGRLRPLAGTSDSANYLLPRKQATSMQGQDPSSVSGTRPSMSSNLRTIAGRDGTVWDVLIVSSLLTRSSSFAQRSIQRLGC